MTSDKKKRRRRGSEKGEFFGDLVGLSDTELKDKISALRTEVQEIERGIQQLQMERENEISMVKSLRSILHSTSDNSKERDTLLAEFRDVRERAIETKAKRDVINELVPPPIEIIEQRLAETYRRLATIPNDLSKMPNRDHEIRLFAFFFELKAMHPKKVLANKLHQEYIECLRSQDDKLKQLDRLRNDRKNIAQEAREEDPGQKANTKEIRKLNARISDMLESIKNQRSELKNNRRELGRLEAYGRVKGKKSRGSSRKIGLRLEDVKSRANSGESLTMEDLGALLNSGGLQTLGGNSNEQGKQKSETQKKSKKRKVGAARGRRRTLNSDERERRQR